MGLRNYSLAGAVERSLNANAELTCAEQEGNEGQN